MFTKEERDLVVDALEKGKCLIDGNNWVSDGIPGPAVIVARSRGIPDYENEATSVEEWCAAMNDISDALRMGPGYHMRLSYCTWLDSVNADGAQRAFSSLFLHPKAYYEEDGCSRRQSETRWCAASRMGRACGVATNGKTPKDDSDQRSLLRSCATLAAIAVRGLMPCTNWAKH